MEILFQNTNFRADQKLLDLITQKLTKLEHYYDKMAEREMQWTALQWGLKFAD